MWKLRRRGNLNFGLSKQTKTPLETLLRVEEQTLCPPPHPWRQHQNKDPGNKIGLFVPLIQGPSGAVCLGWQRSPKMVVNGLDIFLCHLVSRAIWAVGGQRGEVSVDHPKTMLQIVLPAADDKYASGYLVEFPGGQSYRPQANCPSQLTPSGPEKPPIS